MEFEIRPFALWISYQDYWFPIDEGILSITKPFHKTINEMTRKVVNPEPQRGLDIESPRLSSISLQTLRSVCLRWQTC